MRRPIGLWGLLLCVVALTLACQTPAPDSGGICMTSDAYRVAMEEAFNAGHEEARSEIRPYADVELNLFTYTDLRAFLQADQCDRCRSVLPYEEDSVACLERASCLMAHARDAGYYSYAIVMNFKDGAHVIVAFPTKDEGDVYIEPWTDLAVPKPRAGDYYINRLNLIEKAIPLR
jgi:hypothetical protein